MELRNLGKSGLRVSLVGLGCNNFGWRCDREQTRAVVEKALDVGITLFDTANSYNGGVSEQFLGEALGSRRAEIVVATKFGMAIDHVSKQKGASRRNIVAAVEDSLKRLNTDWIDLYQLHTPDPLTPIEETLSALDDLIRAGKVRYVGCSNMPAWQVVDSLWIAKELGAHRFVSCQDEYSLVVRDLERELKPAMEAHGLGLLPYFPLASGALTGKYKRNAEPSAGTRLGETGRMGGFFDRFKSDETLAKAERLGGFAAERGHSLVELAFSWLAAQKPVSSVIAGATSPDQVAQNAKAADWALSVEDLAEIDRLTQG